jgi:molybdopterin molybdotransferase
VPELTDIEDARATVLMQAPRMPAEEVPIAAALGRVLAEPVAGSEPVPAFDNSAMDGYAVLAADTRGASAEQPVPLRVVGESRAGHPAESGLAAGEAIAISTGAMVPGGADAVVRVENTRSADGVIEIVAEASDGLNIRRAGEDIGAGDRLLEPGAVLRPAELGVLASVGKGTVRCSRRPRVAVHSTGDELIGPEDAPFSGAVRNSNAYTVPPLVVGAGGEVERVARIRDDPAATREAIAAALSADVVVVCGGVSVGGHDHVRPALAELGVREAFWGVALRPGKPTWFGTRGDTMVFGLPGNPVSAMVTFLLFARPAIRAMLGARDAERRATAVLDERYEKRPGRAHAVRVRLELADDGWHARPTKEQGSHVLTSMLGADALAFVPADRGDVEAGERVAIEPLR